MRRVLGFVLAVVLALNSAPARADESEEDRKAAATFFKEGSKAYNGGDFRHAAEAFESAYKHAPRLPPLWNAARAWEKGGELVRAANLYASYLRKAPPSAPDRNSATKALRDLETKLSKLEIHAADFTDLKVDGVAIGLDDQNASALVLYVTPGTHVIEGAHAGKTVQERPVATGGTSMSVVLAAQAEVAPPPPPIVVAEKSRGLPIAVVLVGVGLTAVAGGVLIWSGVDTLGAKSTFDGSPTQENLSSGRADETRTNALIAVTAGFAVITGVLAIFVDWSGHKKESAVMRRFLSGTF